MAERKDGVWQVLSWRDYQERVDGFARALIAAGVGRGDKVALMGANSPRWFIADMAVMSMGAVTVPVYANSSSEQMRYLLEHSEAKALLADEFEYFERIEGFLDELAQLRFSVLLQGNLKAQRAGLASLAEFLGAGESVEPAALESLRSRLVPEDPATFIYTSGTTGAPKAVIQTHKNHCAAARNVSAVLHTKTAAVDRVSCSYLPLSHVADRVTNMYSPLLEGNCVYFIDRLDAFAEYLREIRPVLWAGVPRIWEKLHEGVMLHRKSLSAAARKVFDWALAAGLAYQSALYARQRPSLPLRTRHWLARRLIIEKILRAIGLDRAEIAITGGAPTSRDVLDFFFAVGLWLRDVYGQTEGDGTTSIATAEQIRFGSAGKPFPYVKVKIAADGEILLAGDNVSPGYYKDEELSAKTFCGGWLYSGDLGHFDEDGFLWITGRKKDIIITSGGKNITPAKIEAALMAAPVIEHALVVGDGRKHLACLITIDEEAAAVALSGGTAGSAAAPGCRTGPATMPHTDPGYTTPQGSRAKPAIVPHADGDCTAPPSQHRESVAATRQHEPSRKPTLDELAADPRLHELIEDQVAQVNAGLSRAEQLKKFTILPVHFSVAGGELTPILKMRRSRISEKYAAEIDRLYGHSEP